MIQLFVLFLDLHSQCCDSGYGFYAGIKQATMADRSLLLLDFQVGFFSRMDRCDNQYKHDETDICHLDVIVRSSLKDFEAECPVESISFCDPKRFQVKIPQKIGCTLKV
jgi:hypothetical protein